MNGWSVSSSCPGGTASVWVLAGGSALTFTSPALGDDPAAPAPEGYRFRIIGVAGGRRSTLAGLVLWEATRQRVEWRGSVSRFMLCLA